MTWEAFTDYRLHVTYFSRLETELLSHIYSGQMDSVFESAKSFGWLDES